jgi:predicted RecB family nuclease
MVTTGMPEEQFPVCGGSFTTSLGDSAGHEGSMSDHRYPVIPAEVQPPGSLARGQSWVSKTDVTRYLRCPYAFPLTDSGQLAPSELLSPFEAQLAEDGIAFERGIVEAAAAVAMPPGGEAELFAQAHTLLDVRTFWNPRLKLVGQPDGLVTANGALQPVEIKSHRLLQHSDRIELAVYWLLLSELRTANAADPVGWAFLRQRDGSHVHQKIELTAELLGQTKTVIQKVRDARRLGVEPVWCRCTVCRGVRRRQVAEAVRERRDVSSVSGIGPVKREALLAAGYRSWDDLLGRDAEDIARAVNAAQGGQLVSVSEVRSWQWHARALATNQPLMTSAAAPFPVPAEYVAFDAEYTADNVWLLGARMVLRDGDRCFSVWANPAGEARASSEMVGIFSRYPGLPVVTWNGNGADLPAIRKAAARSGNHRLAELIAGRHVDLYGWTRQNLMLPIPSLGLKEVGEHFGISRQSGVTSGLAAQVLWGRYQRTGSQEIKAELVNYNLDDLRSLSHAAECLRGCAAARHPATPDGVHVVLETAVTEHEPGGPPAVKPDPMARRSRRQIIETSRQVPPRARPWWARLLSLGRTRGSLRHLREPRMRASPEPRSPSPPICSRPG